MSRYLLSRLVQFVLVVFGALLLVFLALYIVADPAAMIHPVGTSEAVLDAYRELHGMNDPLLVQTGRFLAGAVQLDFGHSLWLRQEAFAAVLSRLPATFMLAGLATLTGVVLGVLLGVAAARRADSMFDRTLNVVSYFMLSIAEFWLGIMAILVFAVYLDLVPTGGYHPKPSVLILPVSILALRPLSRVFQLTRSTMLGEYNKQYVMTARAKGVSERLVARNHVLHNAGIPIVTLIFYELSHVFVGTGIIIEVVFAWPGLGRLAVGALERGDVFLVQAAVAVAAIAAGILNLTADMLYFGLDPRTRSLVKEHGT